MMQSLLRLAAGALVLTSSLSAQIVFGSGEGSGVDVVPASASTSVIRAQMRVNSNTGAFALFVSVDDTSFLDVGLYQGAKGANGPLVGSFPLQTRRNQNRNVGAANGVLNLSQLTSYLQDGLYVEAGIPSNMIRAQIYPLLPKQGDAIISGQEMVPSVQSPGLGQGSFDVDSPSPRALAEGRYRMTYRIELVNLTNVTGVAIFFGDPGQNGPKVVDLKGSGLFWSGAFDIDDDEFDEFCDGEWHVIVFTQQRPNGELRGQIDARDRDFTARLFVDSATSAVARVIEDPSGFLLAQVTTSGPQPTAIEVREGLPGQGGALLFTCFPIGVDVWFGNSPLPLTPAQSAAVQALQVHVIVRCPTGDLEAQIAKPSLPAAISFGCPGSDGSIGHGQFSYIPTPATFASIDLRGATPNRPGALFVGTQLYPTPIDLDIIGAPGCFTSVVPNVTLPMGTDGDGFFLVQFALPNIQGLIDLDWFGEFVLLDPGANLGGLTFSNAFYDGAFD